MESIKQAGRLLLALLVLGLGCPAFAGGFVELEGDFNEFSDQITNPWLPLPEGSQYVYLAETDDECIVSVLDVLPAGLIKATIKGVKVRTLWDREFVAEGECPDDLTVIMANDPVESTYDWYAQDTGGVIWYFGEHSVATDHDECDHSTDGADPLTGLDGCLDGSWEAGRDIWTNEDDPDVMEGIIMLAEPNKGLFYFQEFWEEEAEDMAKILNFKPVDAELLDDCMIIKEWVPLSPGEIEHKYYCRDYGLVQVAGRSGGKTEWTYLVEVN